MSDTVSGQPPRRFFIGLLLAAGLAPLNSTMIAVALPAIGTEFSAAPADLTQWLVTSYLMLCLVMQSPGGKIGDLWGRSLALRLGLLCFFLGSAAGALAFSIAILVGARLLMALGGAPGIYSARYSGDNANDQTNIDKFIVQHHPRNVI